MPHSILHVIPYRHASAAWRRLALILFGAKIGELVPIRPGLRMTYPQSLGDYVWIGANLTLYSVVEISIQLHAVISPIFAPECTIAAMQRSHL
jgi:acetyltransferase-like isoleucine patch superfamily enzyme